MAGRSAPKPDYWCHPQQDGHPTLYFHGHTLISRAEYVSAVGPEDCEPHIATGRGQAPKRGRTSIPSERERMKRM
jgi:hypothetical protein